jgi:S1-C subfamily serine protease
VTGGGVEYEKRGLPTNATETLRSASRPLYRRGRRLPVFQHWIILTALSGSVSIVTVLILIVLFLQPISHSSVSAISQHQTVTIAGNAEGLFLSLDADTACRVISPTVRVDAAGELSVAGCGFLISPDGLVLSSWHVVADAHKILVSLSNGESYTAEIVTSDPTKDLTLLKLQTRRTDLPFLSMAAGTGISPGTAVMAVNFTTASDAYPGIAAGVVTAVPEINGRGYILADVPAVYGTGEPLVNCQGIALGICLQADSMDSGYVWLAISAADCLDFLHCSGIELPA